MRGNFLGGAGTLGLICPLNGDAMEAVGFLSPAYRWCLCLFCSDLLVTGTTVTADHHEIPNLKGVWKGTDYTLSGYKDSKRLGKDHAHYRAKGSLIPPLKRRSDKVMSVALSCITYGTEQEDRQSIQ